MGMCTKCTKLVGILVVVVGVLFLVRDFGGWNFWNIQGWTAAFLLFGVAMLGKGGCRSCCTTDKKKK